MTKQEYLDRFVTLGVAVDKYISLSQTFKEKATDISVKYHDIDVQQNGTKQPMSIFVEQSLYYSDRAAELQKQRDEMAVVITSGIHAIGDPEQEEVLTLHYLMDYSIEEIGKRLNASRSKAYELHSKALNNLILDVQ